MCPGVELVRFANSGTEATMHALRIARGYTGREKVIKFEGQYHGMYDYVLWSTASANPTALGSRRDPIKYQQSSGIPACIRDLILTLPYNDFELLEAALKREGHQVAAIIVEPILGNAAGIGPKEGWLEFLRQKCDEYGIVLIFDEVKTGFRIAPGGAQELFGVQADLVTYAKAIANGFPLAAIGGKREVMERRGPGRVAGRHLLLQRRGHRRRRRHAGAVGGRPDSARPSTPRANKLKAGIAEILTEAGIPHQIQGPGAMFGLLFMDDEPVEFRDMRKHNAALYEALCMDLVAHGVIPDPDAREPWFLCAAHDDAAIDETLTLFAEAVQRRQGAGAVGRPCRSVTRRNEPFPQIEIEGEAYERGRQYGACVADAIAQNVEVYLRLIEFHGGLERRAARDAAAAFGPILEAHAPDLLLEMRGIADGAGCDLLDVVLINARSELMGTMGECTALAAGPEVTSRGQVLLGQNWDWYTAVEPEPVLLRIRQPGKPEILTLCEAGQVGKIGMNSAGLGVCLNFLSHADQGPGRADPRICCARCWAAPTWARRSARRTACPEAARPTSCWPTPRAKSWTWS